MFQIHAFRIRPNILIKVVFYFLTELDVSFSDDAETPRSGRRSSHSSAASEGIPPELPPRTPNRPVTASPLINGINTPR